MNNDLISREALKEAITQNREIDRNAVCDVLDIIDNAPTVDPQKIVTIPPELIEKLASCVVNIVGNIDWEKAIEAYKARPHGEWTTTKGSLEITCSVCHKGYFYHPNNDFYYDFCPNCGAHMVKETENE